MSDRFTPADYEAILAAANAGGYAFATFADGPHEGRRVYLRHDVDNTLEAAVRLAEIEHSAGAVSTYLVMVRSENYNPFTGESVARLGRLRALGHDVGLHFTADEHDEDALGDLPACIAADATLLERAAGAPVRVFSFHNPTECVQSTVDVPSLVNAYSDRFCGSARYLSESNMTWRHGSPVDVLSRGEDEVVQVLVHPLTFRADLRTDRDVLLWFIREKVETLLEVNVGQNRVLREAAVGMADVAAYLVEPPT